MCDVCPSFPHALTSAPDACTTADIKPGQGMYYSAVSHSYSAVNCDSNSHGVGSITAGLAANPCRVCPAGMHTCLDLPASAAYWASDGAGIQGFTSPMACVTKGGHGYNGFSAIKCPKGSYNAAGNYQPCSKCGAGLTTLDDAAAQVSQDNCTLAPGYGVYGNSILACPLGESGRAPIALSRSWLSMTLLS